MLNRVVLMGRLVSDPELKTTETGLSVTSIRLAVERSYVKNGEERKADFFDIVCWRASAEFVCRYFGKGSLIAVEGRLQSRTYQAKDGTNRYVVEVVADNVSFTGERKLDSNANQPNNGNDQNYTSPYNSNQPYQQTPPTYQSGVNEDFADMIGPDGDLPF